MEKDRERIMEDLDRVKNGDFRKNEASRWVANDIIQKRGPPLIEGIDIMRVKLDPAIKDKLVSD